MLRDTADDDTFPELVPPPAPAPEEPEPIEQIEEDIPQVEEPPQEDDIIVHPEPKPRLKKEDMFISTPSSQKIKKKDDTPDVAPVKKPRAKRQMTEEHKAKLAEARKKGLETRLRNAELRKKAKQEKEEEKEIAKAVRRKRIAKLKQELDEDESPKPKPKPRLKQQEPDPEAHPVFEPPLEPKPQIVHKGYTQEDIDKAISTALEKQETARKARKAEKKKRQEEEAHQKKIYNTVSRAIDPNAVWEQCFN